MKKEIFRKKDQKKAIYAVAALLIFLLSLYLSVLSFNPPEPKPAAAPLDEFSSGRAMRHLQFIAREPHPIGSDFHASVRDYIFEYLRSLNVDVEILKAQVWSKTVHNIIVKIKGTGSGKAVLIMAHYDSVPGSPGASDDGAAVAAMMEIARILSTRLKLKNDVLLLFTDGEETGLLGARAFVKEYPRLRDIGLVFNFEARGCRGHVLMFETSEKNGWIIKEFAGTAPFVFTNSLLRRIYKMFPLHGDFAIFRNKELAGFDFAYIHGSHAYHRYLDNLDSLDEASMQNHGKIMLALLKHFGNIDLSETKKKDRMFFNFLNLKLVHYPLSWVIPTAVLNIILFLIAAFVAVKREEVATAGIIKGFSYFLVNLLYIVVFLVLILEITSFLLGSKLWAIKYCTSIFFISFMSFTLAVNRFLYIRIRKKYSPLTLSFCGLLVWLILSILSSFFIPEGSFIFTWPLLLTLLAVGLTLFFTKLKNPGWANLIVYGIFSFAAVVIVFPIINILVPGLTLNRLSVIITAILFSLLLFLINPLLSYIDYPKRWLLPLVVFSVGLILLISGILCAGNYLDYPVPPRFFNIPYLCY